MDFSTFLFLLQDGIVNGAIYALMALALVLIFTVTRVIFIPIGELFSYAGLTLVFLLQGQVPLTLWFMVILGFLAAISALFYDRAALNGKKIATILGLNIALPLFITFCIYMLPLERLGYFAQIIATIAIIAPMGVYLYDSVYRPVANAPILVLLIISVALHLVMVGLGLVFFGPNGANVPPIIESDFILGNFDITGQSIAVLSTLIILIIGLYIFFTHTLFGKALRATSVNRLGVQLVGISPFNCGRIGFLLASLIAAISGILFPALTLVYYETGFMVGIKGFIAGITGGLISYPISALAAAFIGILESFTSYQWSDYKEVIIFLIIIPVLLWRSLKDVVIEDEEH